MIMSLVGMFVALIVGTVIALAGLAAGIVGLVLMLVYLISIMVFFWELVVREPDLVAEQYVAEHAEDPDEWIADGDWTSDASESATIPLHITAGTPATRRRRWRARSVSLADPG